MSGGFDTLRWRDGTLELLDQRALPARCTYLAFHSAHEVADEGARARPVEVGEPAVDLGGEVLHPADHQRQAAFGLGRFGECPPLRLRPGEPLPQAGHAGPELVALDHPFGVAVDEPADAAAQPGDLTVEGRGLVPVTRAGAGLIQAAPLPDSR